MPNLPTYLKELLNKNYPQDLVKIMESFKFKRYVTVRINTLKTSIDYVLTVLTAQEIQYERVNWYPEALVIINKKEEDLQTLAIYQEGKIYLQSLSSMLPVVIMRPLPKKDILDMAAAPGSKTTQLGIMTNNASFITACEKNPIRCERLKYNLEHQGVTCVNVMNIDATKLSSACQFDYILLDAPCSGSGTYTENQENFITETHFQKINKTQKDLMQKAYTCLKVGGEMVYSTCSIFKEENEDIISDYLKTGKMELIPITLPLAYSVILPNKLPGSLSLEPNAYYEGFFIAHMRKIK